MPASRPRVAALVLLVAVAGCTGTVATPYPTEPPFPPPPGEPTPEPTLEPPPEATLVVDELRLVGRVGSYVWEGGTDAAPWLPAAALERFEVPAGSDATLQIATDPPVESWTVRADLASDPMGDAPLGLDEGRGVPSFTLPGPGSWVLEVHVQFFGGVGDATWYWHLIAG